MMRKGEKPAVDVDFQWITPERAASIVEKYNWKNRPKKPAAIQKYKSIIERGEWLITSQGIAFDVDGRLIDGQNRLLALADSNVEGLWILVMTGLPVETFAVLDNGVRRTPSDSAGVPSNKMCVATFFSTMIFGAKESSYDRQKDVYNYFVDQIDKLVDSCGTVARVVSTSTVKSAAVYMMYQQPEHEEYIVNLYRDLVLGRQQMPPVAWSFLKQIRGTVKVVNKNELLARALKVFSYEHRNKKQLQASKSDESVSKMCKHLRSVFNIKYELK